MSREGPKVTVQYSCFGCRYEESDSYAVQGDSGCHVYCTHPLALRDDEKRKRIGDTTWSTPHWCPFRMMEKRDE